ncbi:hypothetical protein I7I48_02878 [Histoplasma ohiense]|nr:hypothetical protein I7I48_02878 [Histoplasma ohiense (nom. inval.)]
MIQDERSGKTKKKNPRIQTKSDPTGLRSLSPNHPCLAPRWCLPLCKRSEGTQNPTHPRERGFKGQLTRDGQPGSKARIKGWLLQGQRGAFSPNMKKIVLQIVV